jgi:DNA-binding NarL/FixJ family response regulator
VRVAIISSERLFLDGLASIIGGEFHVVLTRTNHRDGIISARQSGAEVIVFDMRGARDRDIQVLLGAQTTDEVKAIVITDDDSDLDAAGFRHSLNRFDNSRALLDLLREVQRTREIKIPEKRKRGRPRTVIHGLELSNREYEVARLVARGCSNATISRILALKEQSVKNLVSTVIRKLRCENRVQVALRLANQPDLA